MVILFSANNAYVRSSLVRTLQRGQEAENNKAQQLGMDISALSHSKLILPRQLCQWP